MSKKNVTMQNVAKHVGVSVATVSAVVNDSKYVSPELTKRVRQAIIDLEYRPNLVARSLKVSETKTIGLIFSNTTSPIWPPIVQAAKNTFQNSGFDTFLVTTDEDVEREKRSINSLVSKRVDGIMIAPAFTDSYDHILEANEFVPIIAIERKIPGIESVVINNYEISCDAVNHLFDHGAKRIGLVTIPTRGSNAAERVKGYRDTLKKRGVYDPSLEREVEFTGKKAYDLALDLISTTEIDAIFATSQSTTIGVLQAAKKKNILIPSDFLLFGYDDSPWMDLFYPSISTIVQPCRKMAQKASEILLEKIVSGKRAKTSHELNASLVCRQSCGCLTEARHFSNPGD